MYFEERDCTTDICTQQKILVSARMDRSQLGTTNSMNIQSRERF
jgi:hypothetical protein